MAYSYHEVIASGGNTFLIPFDYIKPEEIAVYVDGVDTPFSFTSSNVIDITPPPTIGALVRIERTTDLLTRAVDFASGAVLTEEDLDNSNSQVFFAAQEALDKVEQTMRVDVDGKWDSQNRQIKNISAPTANDHAVNLGYLSSNITAVNRVNQSITDVETVSTNIANVNTVADDLDLDTDEDVNTFSTVRKVANNIDDVNSYGNTYYISATAPTGVIPTGSQWFNTTNSTKYIYNGSTWQAYNTSFTTEFVGFKIQADGRLLIEHGQINGSTEDYADWFFGFSDAVYSVDEDGHLKVTY